MTSGARIVENAEGRDSLDFAILAASIEVLPGANSGGEHTVELVRRAIVRYGDGASYRDLALLRGCLTRMLVRQKKYAEARTILADWKSAPANSSDRRQLADLLNTLGMAQLEQGHFAEAAHSYQSSITILEGAVGIEHPLLVAPLNKLGTNLVKMGRVVEAVSTFQRAINICEKTLGRDHITCGILLENYSTAIRKQGRKREARSLENEARQIEAASNRQNGLGTVVSLTSLRAAGK